MEGEAMPTFVRILETDIFGETTCKRVVRQVLQTRSSELVCVGLDHQQVVVRRYNQFCWLSTVSVDAEEPTLAVGDRVVDSRPGYAGRGDVIAHDVCDGRWKYLLQERGMWTYPGDVHWAREETLRKI